MNIMLTPIAIAIGVNIVIKSALRTFKGGDIKMKKVPLIYIVVGVVSVLIGIVSRLAMMPILGLESRAFAGFAALCFLLAIAISVKKD